LKSIDQARQLVILSGKGGTGKTSLCAAFAHLSSLPAHALPTVFVDADVDAANLSLVLKPELGVPHEFLGGVLAEIDPDLCSACGACVPVCRYDAILPDASRESVMWVDPIACDGCAACSYACPTGAIRMVQQQEGLWYQSITPFGALFHAELFPGRENSGKLVTLIKQYARLWAEDTHAPVVIIDGPPGIGCPVISACAGADLALIVSEATLSGVHDLKRIVQTTTHFRIPTLVVINKADIYPEGVTQIQSVCRELDIELIGQIPFDRTVTDAMVAGEPVTAYRREAPSSQAFKAIWEIVLDRLITPGGTHDRS